LQKPIATTIAGSIPQSEEDGLVRSVDRAAEAARSGFYQRALAQNLAPLWRVLHGLVGEAPKSPSVPALWQYEQVRPYLMEACSLISTKESERRVMVLENPGMPGQSRITRSLFCGLQIILPGEIAPAHRHVASALRFIIEGKHAYTAVEGERTMMEPGDFVITPSWTWHDHGNESSGPMVWVDGLDMHIVNMVDASFRENYTEHTYPTTRPEGSSWAEAGANMLPMDYRPRSQTSPIFNYSYRVARDALNRLSRIGPPDACHGYKMQYINPVTGGAAMPTLTTAIQLLPKGFKTDTYRCTAGTVFVVVEGSGGAQISGNSYTWEPHDIFVVPSWHSFSLEANSEAVIFSYSDRIVQEKLDFFREQRGSG
jgi:gentisate 1,2-dioxygenase